MGRPKLDLEARFWRKTDRSPSGCWPWTGKRLTSGYGVVSMFDAGRTPKRYQLYAHRVAYELLVGPIGEGMTLDHTCDVRHCVNPDHLVQLPRDEHGRKDALKRWMNVQLTKEE